MMHGTTNIKLCGTVTVVLGGTGLRHLVAETLHVLPQSLKARRLEKLQFRY